MRATVSYLRQDIPSQSAVREAEGATLEEAVVAADQQLPFGDWKRSGISTVGGIIRSLREDRRRRDSRIARELEGVMVHVRVWTE